jgi:hypothetical protein
MDDSPHDRPYEAAALKLAQHSIDVLFGDVWERPELSKRDRSPAAPCEWIIGASTRLPETYPNRQGELWPLIVS